MESLLMKYDVVTKLFHLLEKVHEMKSCLSKI